jgi:hypothetical protein
MYLSSFIGATNGTLINALKMGPAMFKNCSEAATSGFEAAFSKVKLELLSCLAN